ncbi:MAG: PEP-CTERM sorting domain-containing protein [Planctomycetes bacterium]|jgi:hypothetical protein|nr:PEP-CTERM sorting domain-containing protein [Planctomycetota bacterium]
MVRYLTALTLTLGLTAAAHAGLGDPVISGDTTEGNGSNTSYLVVDFAETNGNSYAFQYNWETPSDAYGMIVALDDALTDLSVQASDFSAEGDPANFFIDNVTFDSDTGDPSKFWTQWEGFFNPSLDRVEWQTGLGVSNIDLADGLFIGLHNPFSFEQDPDVPGLDEAIVPEPTSLALLGLGGVVLLMRKR